MDEREFKDYRDRNPFPLGRDILVDSVLRSKWDKQLRRRHRRKMAWKAIKDYLKELWGDK